MSSVALVGTPITDTNNLDSYTSAAFTPAADALLVVCVYNTGSLATNTTLTASANGLTFTRVLTQQDSVAADTAVVFVADQKVGSTPASMTLTFNTASDGSTGIVLAVLSVAGMEKVSSAAIRQFASNAHTGGATPSVTFAQACLTTNSVIAFIANNTNPPSSGAPAGFTALYNGGLATPTTGLEVRGRDSGHISATVAWSSAGSTGATVAVELDSSVTEEPQPTTSVRFLVASNGDLLPLTRLRVT